MKVDAGVPRHDKLQDLGDIPGPHKVAALLRRDAPFKEGRVGGAGIDDGKADVFSLELLGQPVCEHVDGGLGSGVVGRVGVGAFGRHGPDVDHQRSCGGVGQGRLDGGYGLQPFLYGVQVQHCRAARAAGRKRLFWWLLWWR